MAASVISNQHHVDWPALQVLRDNLPSDAWEEAEEVVGGFGAQGQSAVAAILVRAEAVGKFNAAVAEIRGQYDFFRSQLFDDRGDPKIAANARRLDDIQRAVGLDPLWDRR